MGFNGTEFLDRAWYAIRVKPQHEKAVAAGLTSRGYEEFLPLYRSRRTWSDRIKELQLPLFAGYVFCRFAMEQRTHILRTPGVLSIVGFRTPAPIPPAEIDAVQRAVACFDVEPHPFLAVGDRVRVKGGSLEGVEGILLQKKNRCKLVLSIQILNRSVALELDASLVEPVKRMNAETAPVLASLPAKVLRARA